MKYSFVTKFDIYDTELPRISNTKEEGKIQIGSECHNQAQPV